MRPTAGLGLKAQHLDEALDARIDGLWFEAHAENHLVPGGPRLAWLDAIRARHPLSLHGVGASLGSAAGPDPGHLRRLAALVRRVEPMLVSEHFAWSGVDGHSLPDLLPVPRTRAALARIAGNVARLQDAIGRPIAVENPTHYVRMPGHELEEVAVLAELAARTGCALLVDVTNVHVSAHNLGFDAGAWLDAVPGDRVAEVHLSGPSRDPALGDALWIDSHARAVPDAAWALYERLVARIGPRPTLVERDADVPAFGAMLRERERAAAVLHRYGSIAARSRAAPRGAFAS
jgi:uncharacterized protein (UPF0276 family)